MKIEFEDIFTILASFGILACKPLRRNPDARIWLTKCFVGRVDFQGRSQ